MAARAMMGMAMVERTVGHYADGITRLEAALVKAQSCGSESAEALVIGELANIYAESGQLRLAQPLLERVEQAWRRLGHTANQAVAQRNLAELLLDQAQTLRDDEDPSHREDLIARAKQYAHAGMTAADDHMLRRMQIETRTVLARLHLASGDAIAAFNCLQVIEVLLADYPSSVASLEAKELLAQTLALMGRPADALQQLRDALAIAEQNAMAANVPTLWKQMSTAYETLGQFDQALAAFRKYHHTWAERQRWAAEQRATFLATRLHLEYARRDALFHRDRANALAQDNDELRQQAHVDALTGLPNRRAFDRVLAVELTNPNRAPSRAALALVDLDHFKKVNDLCSHVVGDAVLKRVGELITQTLRRDDFAARIGGEEFALLLRGADAAMAAAICTRLQQQFHDTNWQQVGTHAPVTASVGVSLVLAADTYESLLARSDAAMYRAKAQGRDQVVVAPAPRSPSNS